MKFLFCRWPACTMLRPLLLIYGFTFVGSAASLNCVEKEVHSNSQDEVGKFASNEGILLFYPLEDFDGVNINVVVHEKETANINAAELCVNGSRWYKLKVIVEWSYFHQTCTFQVDACSGKCGSVRDLVPSNFQHFSVVARGASFWSLNDTLQESKCTGLQNFNITEILDSNSHRRNAMAPKTGPVAVYMGSAALIAAAVVVVVCIIYKAPLSRAQQRQDDNPARDTPIQEPENSMYIRNNSLHEPFLDRGLVQQRQNDGLPRGHFSSEGDDEVYVVTNSIYEPFCDVTDSGLVQQRQNDGLPRGHFSSESDDEVYVVTNSIYEPFCDVTDSGGVRFDNQRTAT